MVNWNRPKSHFIADFTWKIIHTLSENDSETQEYIFLIKKKKLSIHQGINIPIQITERKDPVFLSHYKVRSTEPLTGTRFSGHNMKQAQIFWNEHKNMH